MRKFILLGFIFNSLFLFSQEFTISSGPKDNFYIQYSNSLLLKVYNEIGITPQFTFTSFERSLLNVNSGAADAESFRVSLVGSLYSDIEIVKEPLFYIRIMAFTNNPNLVINNWKDLENLKVAFIRGIKLDEFNNYKMELIKANTHEDAFTLLVKNRVDVVVSGDLVGKNIIKNYENIIFYSHILEESPAFHFINNKHKDLIPKLVEAIKLVNSEK